MPKTSCFCNVVFLLGREKLQGWLTLCDNHNAKFLYFLHQNMLVENSWHATEALSSEHFA